MLNWNQIDTVFLDMDGTLLDLHFDNYFWMQHLPKRFADTRGMTLEESNTFLSKYFRDLKGTLNWYCFDYWSDLLDMDLIQLKHEVKDKIAYRPFAEEFLSAISAGPYRVLLVTNSHRAGVEIKMQCTNLGDYIDEVHTSHDFGLPKEDPVFWTALRKKVHFDPRSTVFFDDNEDVLHSAKKAGLVHLINIVKPDSRGPMRVKSDYPLLSSFMDVMPSS
ncbi:MAG: GMP/IMP nucleotidase [Oleiphilaceae bacterium]|nr:GMP/IMP nucleotidase [Oleiphilaceae bacterium]